MVPWVRAFKGWYVSLQRPLVPSRFGCDSMDLLLEWVSWRPPEDWTLPALPVDYTVA